MRRFSPEQMEAAERTLLRVARAAGWHPVERVKSRRSVSRYVTLRSPDGRRCFQVRLSDHATPCPPRWRVPRWDCIVPVPRALRQVLLYLDRHAEGGKRGGGLSTAQTPTHAGPCNP